MLAALRKWILILVLLAGSGFLLYKGFEYRLSRNQLPAGTSLAGLDVAGLTQDQAVEVLEEQYYKPVYNQ